MKLTDLNPAPYNPRLITGSAFEGLKFSLEEFGDISGIVFNQRTGNLVAGHQRVKALTAKFGECQIVNEKIITPIGEFSIRIVNWDEQKEKAANIAANNPKLQGEFTSELKLLINEINLKTPDLAATLRINEISIPTSLNSDKVNFINHQDEWQGLPLYEDGLEPIRLVVLFEDEENRKAFLEMINVETGFIKKGKVLSIRWPVRIQNDLASLKFESDHENS